MKFKKGDRVKLLKKGSVRDLVKLGQHGLVVGYGYECGILISDCYEILFDGEDIAYSVTEDEIEIIKDNGLSLLSLVSIINEDIFHNKNVTGTITDMSCDDYGEVSFEVYTPFNGKVYLSINDFHLKEDE